MGTTPRVLIVGVPPTSGAIYVSRGAGGGGWRVIVVLLWRMYVGMICGTRWEAGAGAHWSRYSGWWSGSGGDGGDGNGGGGSGVFF